MSNVLDLFDQTAFDIGRATGATTLLQCVWVYNRPIDTNGLKQFHEHLQQGRLSRCIEPSPLPFGRHRWISPNCSSDIEIVAPAGPREHFDAWLNERLDIPLDLERGPGWHLAVHPFRDGGTGISLVISHCLTDGVGLSEALADAALGRDDPISWPAGGSRRRWQALREDFRQAARDTPAIGRAVVSATRLARHSRGVVEPCTRLASAPAAADECTTIPTAIVFVDADEWDDRAHSLGGTPNTLLAGLAARLAQRLGRVTADGSVALAMPVNERAAGDTRANATTEISFTVDPALATTDLREIRASIKRELIRDREVTDERRALLHIVPLVPQRLTKRMVKLPGSSAYVVSSNIGVVNPAAIRPDGTDADYFAMKLLPSGLPMAMMHGHGGLQVLLSGRAQGQVFVSVVAYQPGRPNSNELLQQDISGALNDFALTGRFL